MADVVAEDLGHAVDSEIVPGLLTLFLEPAIELRQVARDPNRVAIVIDRSQSMGLREDPAGDTRIERARAILDKSAATLDGWQSKHEIDVYEFAEALVPSSRRTSARKRW